MGLLAPHFKWLSFTIAAGVGCFATTSCNNVAEPTSPVSYRVSETQARAAAENIAFSAQSLAQVAHNRQTADTQRVFQGPQPLASITAVASADGLPAAYICNYTKGGFAVIAADRHMQPVLAFAARGSFPVADLRNPKAMPEGLLSWLETTKAIAVALRQSPNENNPVQGAANEWKALVDNPGPAFDPTKIATAPPTKSNPASRVPPNTDPPPSSSTQRGPLLLTTWGQGCGYNDYVPSSSRGDYCYHCPTGCVATAMAQIMNYWHYPANAFNWGGMQPTSGTPATAQLMQACGNAVHMSYGENSSGADDDYVDDMLKGRYGYSSADFISNQDPGLYNNVINDINNNRPVLLGGFSDTTWGFGSGSGHSWVCDGYIQSYIEGNGYLSFHMNWGWDGRSNGWCSYNDWSVRTSDGVMHQYNYAKTYTINIHP
jgi:hypothetical protein